MKRQSSFQTILTFCTGFVAGISFLSIEKVFNDPNVVIRESSFTTTLPTAVNDHFPSAKDSIDKVTEESIAAKHVNLTLLPESMRGLAVGMARVSRDDFGKQFDIGYGLDKTAPDNQEVLLIYGSQNALPENYSHQTNSDAIVPLRTMDEATQNCDTVKVVLTNPKPKRAKNKKEQEHKECIAVMGQWESYHVHKFERNQKDGAMEYRETHHRPDPPSLEEQKASQEALLDYLTVYNDALERLRPIAEKVVSQNNGGNGPIIVMVANYGQVQFFTNFMCSAAARNLDTSRVLLFATDEQTFQIATAMGVAVFYDKRIFQSIPSGAAKDYHDMNYGRIMMSKVYCVHMVNALGYDLLFQDLDLVWYKDPLPYFQSKLAAQDGEPVFDMYFQSDGTHHPERFAPLAANTGFYYVRHNERTRHFFSVFVRMGDLVITDKSHQAALTTLVNQQMSLRGLRVKVLAEDSDLFLSGFHRHARPRVMKQTLSGNHKPYLYHVNWMSGNEKQPVLKESNNWYVQEHCSGKTPDLRNVTDASKKGDYFASCCLVEPFKQ